MPAKRPLVIVLLLGFLAPAGIAGTASAAGEGSGAGGQAPVVTWSSHNDVSPPLREMPVIEPREGELRVLRLRTVRNDPGTQSGTPDGLDELSAAVADAPVPAPIRNFDGIPNVDGVLPPDTDGDAGLNHYVQMINLSFSIYRKDGTQIYGPATNNTLWQGFGGPCETSNDGDPIVLFDHLSSRWMLSQFAVPGGDQGFYECIAISKTSDPTGAYYRYGFKYSDTIFNDYPKLGVWPDAYYMSVRQFDDVGFAGVGVVAYERERMLQGLPARQVIFDLDQVERRFHALLPADLDGPAPPHGTPNYFAGVTDSSQLPPSDAMRIWEFHVDWTNPESSTFGLAGQPNQVLSVAPFNMMLCRTARPPNRSCIPQPAGPPLDDIGDRAMYRLQYRLLPNGQPAMTVNHTVDADVDHAGVRWYEVRQGPGGWAIEQQGTHAPDLEHRWMASSALDNDGNLAVGYSVSSLVTFPSIRYAGRLAGDPDGTLPQTETSLIEGSGSQLFPTAARWGDYSAMAVDPTDECTFWYTNEYIRDTDLADWRTRIGAFRFPSCTPTAMGTLAGTIRDAGTGAAVEQAVVRAGAYSAVTDRAGRYVLPLLPVGTYEVSISGHGYAPRSFPGVVIRRGKTTTLSTTLTSLTTNSVVEGTVTDGSGHGWPLYSMIEIEGYPLSPIFTDPLTGRFTATLEPGEYAMTVTPVATGYGSVTRTLSVPASSSVVEDVAVPVDAETCTAPGYEFVGTGLFQPFADGSVPDGWTVQDNSVFDAVWRFDDPGNRGNLTGGSGLFATVDSDFYGTGSHQDTELISPSIDLTELTEVTLAFDTDFRYYAGAESLPEKADVDVSTDGGETWTNVWRRENGDYRGPRHEVVDISALAAGEADVRMRFHYYDASFEWWWQVDNARIGELVCEPLPGGLVVGNVRDAKTGTGLNGATVEVAARPDELATTFATPDDPAVPDGFYVLFSSATGIQRLVARADGYRSQARDVEIVADAAVRRDFALSRTR